MKSRLILNLALLAVIAVLGAVAYFQPGKQKVESTSLVAIDANAVSTITLQNSGTLVFERRMGNGGWLHHSLRR